MTRRVGAFHPRQTRLLQTNLVVAAVADCGCRSQRLRLQVSAFQKDRPGAFHFVERATDVARLKLNPAAAIDHDVRVKSEALVFASGSSKFPLEEMEDKSKALLRIFVLADTHNRLPDNVKEIARDADEIWHLGDVCAEAILDELRAVGPRVTLVRGNCDSNFEWPLVVDLVRSGLKFRLQHAPPSQPPDDADVLLHGHTHVPRNERRGNVLFLNPGCVTRPNRGSPPSAAWLEIIDERIDWKVVPLR